MSMTMEEEFKRWTAKLTAALFIETDQVKTSVVETSQTFDILPLEIKDGMTKEAKDSRTYCMPSRRQGAVRVSNQGTARRVG